MSVAHYDTLVIGSGVAGLSFLHYYKKECARVSKHHSVALFCKAALENTNTNWAQGGIAAVAPQPNIHHDSTESHIQDTLIAGAHVNNKEVVKKVIEQGPQLMQDLISMGMPFDTNQAHQIDLAKEGGHAAHRVWHVKDYTGKALQQTLLHSIEHTEGLSLFEHCLVVSIDKNATGQFVVCVYDIKNNQFKNYTATHVVLATGGIGQLYAQTTNAPVATADGIYLANLLGAQIENLSFIQFHPTGLYANGSHTFLISEALRGAGAVLRNHAGVDFMHKYHPSGSLAPRDIVSRAIISEMENENVPYQFLDTTTIDKNILQTHFPLISETVKTLTGIDIATTFIPIVPTQHYSCGGIKVDTFGESTVQNLFAIGECASTGLHGANRLASNSLLEGLAFAKFAAQHIAQRTDTITDAMTEPITDPASQIQVTPHHPPILAIDTAAIKEVVSKYAGVKKSTKGIQTGLGRIEEMIHNAAPVTSFSVIDFEANSILNVALLLFKDAAAQQKNVGVFYNESIA
jgi:L-aspartate oxidase